MALKRVEITELKGINRNAVEGVPQQQPKTLRGFDFDRGGGYRAQRGKETLTTSGTFAGTVVGFDDAGYVSLGSFSGSNSITLRLYDGSSTVYTQSGTATSDVNSVSDYYHLEGVGAVGNLELAGTVNFRTVHLITKSGVALDGNDFASGAPSITLFTDTSSSQGVLTSGSTYRVWLFRSVNTQKGQFWVPNGQTSTRTISGTNNALTLSWDFNASSSIETDTDLLVYLQDVTSASSPVGVPASLVAVNTSASTSITIESTFGEQVDGPPAIIQYDGKAVFYRQRFYGKPSALPSDAVALYTAASFGSTGNNPNTSIATKSKLSIVYSKIGTVNAWQPDQYFVVPFSVSKDITGLAPTPAGLLIFGDNETFLARSDPALSDFSVQLVSGVIGCDDGVDPVKLGGVVFTVYKGEIYAISLGMGDVDFGSGITEISNPVFNPDDPFVELASEADARMLVAHTNGGTLLRYDAEAQQWFTDVYGGADNVTNIFSNPDSDGVRYYISSSTSKLNGAYGTQIEPRIIFEDVDLGDKHRKKMWRRLRVSTNDAYTGTPEVFYSIAGSTGTISASETQDENWVFTLPAGLVASTAKTLNIQFPDMASGDTVEPPIIIEVVDRYTQN